MKICPFCAEEIQLKAIKCKQCGEMLNTSKAKQLEEKEESESESIGSKLLRGCLVTVISLGAIMFVTISTCSEERTKTVVPPYRIINDANETKTYDALVKVMEVRRLLVQENIPKEELRKVLNDMYARLRKKRGYKYSSSGPTQIGIYAHTSVDSYMQSGASWVGMLWWDEDDLIPNISFSSDYE